MANKYAELNAKAILLNDGQSQLLPVSKAKLIELANADKTKFTGYDVDNATSVEDALTYLLNKGNSDLETAKTHTTTSINALNSTYTARTGYVLTGITETAGVLTAYTEEWLDASVVSYNGNSNVKEAIEDLQSTLAGLAGNGQGSVQEQIAYAIDNLTYNTAGTANKAVVAVTQTDGVIAPVQGNVDAKYINVDNTNNVFGLEGDAHATTLDAQTILEHLQGEIEDLDESAATYTIEKRTQNLDANVKEQYVLRQTVKGTTTDVQVPINIYKDSQLLAAGISTTDATYSNGNIVAGSDTTNALVLVYSVYKNDAWTEEVVHIPVADFFSSLTAGDGLTESNGVINVVKGSNSEDFLYVNSDSIEIKGVQTAINTAETNAYNYVNSSIAGLDSEIKAKTDNDFSYVMTGVTETDGKLTNASYIGLSDVTVKTTAFDANSDLYKLLAGENLPTNLHDALNKIAGKVNNTQAGAVNNIVITDGSYIKATKASKDGNNTYSFTIDDSALGNVAKLRYDELTWDGAETVTILGANPNE